jgi:membrane-associated protease RseP (regulator of RpoE activity)
VDNKFGNGVNRSLDVERFEPLPLVMPHSIGPARREIIVSLLLFFLTFLTTTLAGAQFELNFRQGGMSNSTFLEVFAQPSLLFLGLPFSLTLLIILLSHEMGHYLACRYYAIHATLPYFLPIPFFSPIGTLGAFIRIKAPFVGSRALFDVGVAGPIAGFVFVIPALIIGIWHSQIVPLVPSEGLLSFDKFGRPLLFEVVAGLLLPYVGTNETINLHPIGWAAWFGLFATCLNLLPIGQLDGGHMTYALFGRRLHKVISLAFIFLLIPLGVLAWPTPSYLVFATVLFIIGLRHPQTLNDGEPVGKARFYVGLLALLIFLLCFIPIPISLRN